MSTEPESAVIYPSHAINRTYFPSLNGLRGISIILIVVFHLWPDALGIIFNGALGVNIFFVLSGFLITSLCIKEINITNGLSLKNFYLRRILRIFPVAYLYILVIFLLNIIFQLDVKWIQFAGASLYLANFSYFRSHDFSWFFGHYWSLATEEQFYLIFPVFLKGGKKLFFFAVVFIVFVVPVLCSLQVAYPVLNTGFLYFFTHYFIKFQSIAVGCLFSILTLSKVFDSTYLAKTKIPGNLIAIFFIFYLRFNAFYAIENIYTNLLISIFTAYIIISNLVPANDWINKTLNLKALSFIGVLSYSIYIWQQIFTSNNSHLPKYIVEYPYNLIWIIAIPCISYYFFERYFLLLKKRFKIV